MAGTVDTSIYGQIAGPQDPLGALAKVSQIRAMNNSNMQFQQEYRSRLAMGQIMQQAVGPDGQPDYTKAATMAAQNPDAAWMAPDLMNKAVTMQGVSLDNVMKGLDNTRKRLGLYGSAAASILPKGASMTRDDLTNAVSELSGSLHDAGVHDQGTYDGMIQFLAGAPQGGQALYDYVNRAALQAGTAGDTMDRLKGSFQTVDSGDASHMYSFNPQYGGMQYIGSVPKKPSPEQMNDLVDVTDPMTGASHKVPRYLAAPMAQGGGQQLQIPPQGPAPQGGAPTSGPQDGMLEGPGQQPQEPSPAGPQPAPQPSAANVTPQGFPTANVGPLRTGQLKNTADYQQDLNNQVSTINQNIQQIQRLQDLSSKVHTGMFAESRLELGRVLKSLGAPDSVYNGVSNGSLAGSQEIMKYSVPNAMNTLRNSLGSQSRITNMEFGAFQRANPNLETDPDAFNKILAFTHQMMDLKIKEQKGFQTWQQAGRDPTQFQEAWAQQLIKRGLVHPADDYSEYGQK